jgi:hypothetical protein
MEHRLVSQGAICSSPSLFVSDKQNKKKKELADNLSIVLFLILKIPTILYNIHRLVLEIKVAR